MTNGRPGLSPRLEEALDGLTERELAGRLRAVYGAAAQATEQLARINLAGQDRADAVSADLSLWEEMAPVVADTLVAVDALLRAIRAQFPDGRATTAGEAPASLDARLALEVESVFVAISDLLTVEVTRVRDAIRRPDVVSDRWALLTELEGAREQLRGQVENLVYLTAAAFSDVTRAEVVPGYQEAVDAAALLRSTAADLKRSLEAKLLKLIDEEDAARAAHQLSSDLDFFARMPAFLTLRAPEKREVAIFQERLQQAGNAPLATEALRDLFSPFLALLQAIGQAVTKGPLAAPDRAVWDGCGLSLEQAELHNSLRSGGARRALEAALDRAQALYGRDPAFDAYLRRARNLPVRSLADDELARELDALRDQLGRLSFQ